jgi:predicted TPR repeat methyltransferase
MSGDENPLDALYTEGAVTDAVGLYDDWSEYYEADLKAIGYAAAHRCAAALAKEDPNLTSPVVDLGCGTGLSGEALKAAGFAEIDGYDFSDGMLALARKKNCYRDIVHTDLSQPNAVPDKGYRHAALVGVLHHTHAPPEAISGALALLPKGGCVVFTLNDETLRFPEYTVYVDELVSAGEVEIASMEYGPHLPARDVGARVYVLRKL